MTFSRYTRTLLWARVLLTLTLFLTMSQAVEYNVCSPNYPSGQKCVCYPNSNNRYTVTCTAKSLTTVPTPFPNYHTIILSQNQITEILIGPFKNVTALTDLYLQNNYISHIQKGAFGRLMKLENINLANNYLRSINSDMFNHLASLSTLDLSNNLITTVDRRSFMYLPSLVQVNMQGNRLNCSCEEKLLKDFLDLRVNILSVSNARCVNFGNISITDVSNAQWSSGQSCSGETFYLPDGSKECHSCADAKGRIECNNQPKLACYGPRTQEDLSNESFVLCTRTENVTCWNHQVTFMNKIYSSQMIPVVIMMAIFMAVGIVGNCIVLFMNNARRHKTSANIFIMWLAGLDLFACVVIHPYVIFKLFNLYSQIWTVLCKIFEFLVHLNLLMSGLFLLLVAVDRYYAICKPIKYLKFYQHIMKAILITSLVALGGSIPILEFYGPYAIQFNAGTVIFVGYICHYQEKYIGSTSMAGFSGFMMTGFLTNIVIMTILYRQVALVAYRSRRTIRPLPNAHALVGLKRSVTSSSYLTTKSTKVSVVSQNATGGSQDGGTTNLQIPALTHVINPSTTQTTNATSHPALGGRNFFAIFHQSTTKTKPKRSDERTNNFLASQGPHSMRQITANRLKAAKILFTVTFVFFLSWMPFFIIRICKTVSDGCNPTSYSGQVFDNLLNHVFYINNAVNPILYTVINKSFRQEFRNMLRKRLRWT